MYNPMYDYVRQSLKNYSSPPPYADTMTAVLQLSRFVSPCHKFCHVAETRAAPALALLIAPYALGGWRGVEGGGGDGSGCFEVASFEVVSLIQVAINKTKNFYSSI